MDDEPLDLGALCRAVDDREAAALLAGRATDDADERVPIWTPARG